VSKPGPAPKPADQRQAHPRAKRPGPLPLSLVPADPVPAPDIPSPPRGLLRATQSRWRAYWTSPVASAVIEADRGSVDRLFRYYDAWERMMRESTASPFTEGSQGQVVVHPACARVDKLEAHIAKLEGELGLTPLARSRLGIAVGQAQLTADELNRRTRKPDRGDSPSPPQTVDADFAEFEAAGG
jgi:P27 family predicted phage terminase small subunit